MSTVTEFHL